MKRLNLLIAALGLAAGAANAQPPWTPPGGRFDLDDLAILLDLDAYQKGEVERVLTEQREAMRAEGEAQRAAREQNDGEPTEARPPPEEFRARRDEDREAVLGKLQNVLSEQQLTKLKILMQPPQGGRGARGGGPLRREQGSNPSWNDRSQRARRSRSGSGGTPLRAHSHAARCSAA